jgi:hypothetical protein
MEKPSLPRNGKSRLWKALPNEALNLSRRFAPRRLTPGRYDALIDGGDDKSKVRMSNRACGI